MEKKIPIAANYIFTKELKEKVEALEGIKGDKLVFKLNGSIVFLSVHLFVFFSLNLVLFHRGAKANRENIQ